MLKRGQSAVEYFMTYGIVLVIILAVMASLYYLYSRTTVLTPNCSFPVDLSCYAFKYNSSGLTLNLGQSTGHPITVLGINCTQQNNAANIVTLSLNVTINDGEHKQLPTIQCYGLDGMPRYGSTGANYIGKMYIVYNESDTQMQHFLTGDIIAQYE